MDLKECIEKKGEAMGMEVALLDEKFSGLKESRVSVSLVYSPTSTRTISRRSVRSQKSQEGKQLKQSIKLSDLG